MKVRIYVEAEVNPTEDAKKVRRAVGNVFDGKIDSILDDSGKGYIRGEGGIDDLNTLKELITWKHIRKAARAKLTSQIKDNSLIFYLNKQVAYTGHISFCESEGESPLGPIRYEIYADNPVEIVEWLTKDERKERKKRSSKQ